MKCSLCGADLIAGNNTCPSCGALNMAFNQAATPAPVQTNTSAMPSNQPAEQPSGVEVLAPSDAGVEVLETPQEVAKAETTEGEVIDASTSGFVDLDEGEAEAVQATEDMAAPSLDLNNENLTANAQDISSSADVATYDPTQAVPEDNVDDNLPKESGINFALPEVNEAAQDTQGMAIKEIETKGDTVGEESAPVKEKFSLKIFKKKSLPRNVVLILLAVIFIIGILVGSLLFGKKVYSPGNTASAKKGNNIPHVADGNNNVTYAGNMIYKIPTQYDYDKQNGGILVYGGNDEYRLYIKAIKGSYEQVANAKESIRLSLNNISLSTSQLYETSVNEHGYVVINSTVVQKNKMFAIRDGIEGYVFYIEIVTADNNYDASLLNIADDIINSVELNEKYTTMENTVLEDVAAVIVTTAEAKQSA